MFIILERHYNLIFKQANQIYPFETGGLLGGKDKIILGVYPIVNMADLSLAHESFGITHFDLEQGQKFFKWYDLEFIGTYHTHPKAPPTPSKQDLKYQGHQLMIIGMVDRYYPDIKVFNIEKGKAVEQDIKLIRDEDLNKYIFTRNKNINELVKTQHKLVDQVTDIIETGGHYSKEPPSEESEDSSFSVLT